MVIYATEYEKQLIVRALCDYARQCYNVAQAQAVALAAAANRVEVLIGHFHGLRQLRDGHTALCRQEFDFLRVDFHFWFTSFAFHFESII